MRRETPRRYLGMLPDNFRLESPTRRTGNLLQTYNLQGLDAAADLATSPNVVEPFRDTLPNTKV